MWLNDDTYLIEARSCDFILSPRLLGLPLNSKLQGTSHGDKPVYGLSLVVTSLYLCVFFSILTSFEQYGLFLILLELNIPQTPFRIDKTFCLRLKSLCHHNRLKIRWHRPIVPEAGAKWLQIPARDLTDGTEIASTIWDWNPHGFKQWIFPIKG